MKMFSVIAPVYRAEDYLQECVDSILAQSYTDFELILVDDGSPDRSGEMCDEYAIKDSRVRVIHQPNGGLIKARKAGIAAAKGEYICFVDSDDFISDNMLAEYNDILKSNNVDIICAGLSKYYGNSIERAVQRIQPGLYSKERLEKEVYPRMLSTKPFFSFSIWPSVCSKCFRRELVENIYPNVPDSIALGEDVALTYPALLSADAVYIADYYGYMYRQNLNSMTHTYDNDLYVKLKVLLSYLMQIADEHKWDAGQQICEYAVYLLLLAKNNELVYNLEDTYAIKKKKLKEYLDDAIFMSAMEKSQIENKKERLILFCLKHRLILPLFLWSEIRQFLAKSRGNA